MVHVSIHTARMYLQATFPDKNRFSNWMAKLRNKPFIFFSPLGEDAMPLIRIAERFYSVVKVTYSLFKKQFYMVLRTYEAV